MRSETLLKPTDKKNKANTLGIIAFLIVTSILLIRLRVYHFVDTVLFPHWPVALVCGALIGALITFWLKRIEKQGNIKLFVIMTLLSIFFAGAMIAHLNHYLDPNEPVIHTVVIEDKDYERRRRKSFLPGYYEFTVTVDGKTYDIDVPREHYQSCQTGDLYVIEYHTGAFGEPYYIAAGKATDDANPPTP